MSVNIMEQLDLFTEPKKEKRNYNFDITLQCGGVVNVNYQNPCFSDYPHIEFRGIDISETGYYSLFPQWDIYPDDTLEKIKEIALSVAEKLHTEKIQQQRKNRGIKNGQNKKH